MKFTRREFLEQSIVLLSISLLSKKLSALELNKLPKLKSGRAKSVIEIWLWGGPSHLETFDPKPAAGEDYNGGFKAIPTNVSGIQLSEFLPNLAKHADKFSLIRSMTHGINAHETATYLMQTGREPGGKVFPSIGAVIGLLRGYDFGYTSKIPPYIVLTREKGRFSELGFLSPKYKPLVTGGDPNAPIFAVEGIINKSFSRDQQIKRREFLKKMNLLSDILKTNKEIENFENSENEAYELIAGSSADVFDLSKEKPELRDRYGRNTFGQSCIVARRLVEAGVPYITINSPGWDTHKRHFFAMKQKLPQLDMGLSSLLTDLHERGLLNTTIVWCCGEFGRQPKISKESPWNGGRQHWGKCFSALVAGGGFKGGEILGKSDARGEEVAERPVYPQDFLGSIYELMGINPDDKLPNPMNEDIKIMPPPSKYGRIKELYN
ncbi:MAG TPA: DUF1501 domain-containing protein [Victivallales bacterium]|nr:DUF1501 domain-containing protein [Victivallales bacterium]